MKPDLVAELLLLLAIANGAPILATFFLGRRLSWPVDGGARFLDGRPFFGPSKTFRGLAASLAATAPAAALLGWPWTSGAAFAALAMVGDLLSSFVKRRFALPPSARALGLDHFPESALPVLYAATIMPLTMREAALVIALFLVGGFFLSRMLYALHIREQPY